VRSGALPTRGGGGDAVADGWDGILAHRRLVEERRMQMAAPVAAGVVADLVEFAAGASDAELEDALCVRFGRHVVESDNDALEAIVGPDPFAMALALAAAAAVRTALDTSTAWQQPWRILIAVSHMVAYPLQDAVETVIEQVRAVAGAQVLPATAAGPATTGEVFLVRDGYGSRFAVLADFSTTQAPQRWYLWDVDACGREPVTVHGAFHPSAEAGFAAWRAAVGEAAADAALTLAEDPALLVELLPAPEGLARFGGENAELMAEYHRCRRLAATLLATFDDVGPVPAESPAVSAAEAFLSWARQHRPEALPEPVEDDDGTITAEVLAAELADSWCASHSATIYHTCSPHRLATLVPHLRGFYRADFAGRLVDLLPAWSDWLAVGNGTPPELARRCRPYATGDPAAGPLSDKDPNRYARVRE
jgi:hypothetical protein